jgi:hypothetical protein
VNGTSVTDINSLAEIEDALIPSSGFACTLESYGEEFIINIINESISIVTVNRGFDVRFEKNGEVICGGRFVFGDDFHLQDEISFTEMLPDSFVCPPGTEKDTEHQSYNIIGHKIKLNIVCDISKMCGNEVVYYDYPQTFNFGLSLVPFSDSLESEYPEAFYTVNFPSTPKTTITESLWNNTIMCDNVKNLPLHFDVVVSGQTVHHFLG